MSTRRLAAILSCAIAALSLSAAGWAQAPAAKNPVGPERWVYVSHNFAAEKNCDEVIGWLQRAAKAGYTHVLVVDCKFMRWNEVKRPDYDNNLKRVRKACRDLGLKVIACGGAQGTDLLSNDPNLAEGQPVVNAPFLVKDGKLVPADRDLALLNGSFEEQKDGLPAGWAVAGKNAAVDAAVACDGRQSVRIRAATQLSQKIKLVPNRYYRLIVKIKSQDLDPAYQFNVYLAASDNSRLVCYKPFGIAKTQDWTEYSFEFNTMDVPEMSITFGIWGEYPGTVWVDGMRVEPGGFVNLIRRDGCPFKLTSEDGRTVYSEGADFAGAKDPALGMAVVNGGVIPGIYDYWHEPPVVTVPRGSRLKEGQRVLASYGHSINTLGWGTFVCMNEPKIWDWTLWGIRNLKTALEPDGWMLTHDEIRHQGWDDSCVKAGKPLATVLADNIRRCVELVRREDPGKPIYIWSDMIDPNMNAGPKGWCYLVKGEAPWFNSWAGLDKDLIIMNWNYFANDSRRKSIEHFAKLGHKQVLCGYYDQPVENLAPWLKEASDYPGVRGVMFTTWVNRFDDLEKFSKAASDFKP